MELATIDTATLRRHSIHTIESNQHASGAYPASPNFPKYRYSWLRDGTFIAHAMDRVGRSESAGRFYDWVDRCISERIERVEHVVEATRRGEHADRGWALPARMNLDGTDDTSGWPTYQIDGYGTWLWGIVEHARITGDDERLQRYERSIDAVISYLAVLWDHACCDIWEEAGENLHTSTLACVYGGLHAVGYRLNHSLAAATAERVKQHVLEHHVRVGRLVKNDGHDGVDASLLWVSVPFGLLPPDDERMVRTVQTIYGDLVRDWGVKRYRQDTYYGGGSWILLAAWLGLYEVAMGRTDQARGFLRWIESRATEEGDLPEQVPEHLISPPHYPEWIERWGPIATPLLWSHAMYLELTEALAETR